MAETEQVIASFERIAEAARKMGEATGVTVKAFEAVHRAIVAFMPPTWEWLGLDREPTDWAEWLWVSWSFVRERNWRHAKIAWWEAKRAFRVEVDSMC